MRLTAADLAAYESTIAVLLERYGVSLDLDADAPIALEESPNGALSFELRGFLPDGRRPPLSVLLVREKWGEVGRDSYERLGYEYELLDHERRFRRAYHLHDVDHFVRRFNVAVHEHCERPIGVASCPHFEGSPIRDGFRGVEILVDAWTNPTIPDCAVLSCLE